MSKKDRRLQEALAGRTKIGPKAIANIKADLGIKGGIKSAAQNLGIKIKSGSSGSSKSGGASVPSSSFSSESGLNPAAFDYQSALNLVNAQGNIDTQIANINSDASRYISELQVGGAKDVARIEGRTDRDVARIGGRTAKDVAQIQSRTTRYVADRELESNLGVENIRAKGAVDLQKIVNAGMERVENIRGEFGVRGKKIDRSTAILGGLVSAFNF
jgi:hypothetical protein